MNARITNALDLLELGVPGGSKPFEEHIIALGLIAFIGKSHTLRTLLGVRIITWVPFPTTDEGNPVGSWEGITSVSSLRTQERH